MTCRPQHNHLSSTLRHSPLARLHSPAPTDSVSRPSLKTLGRRMCSTLRHTPANGTQNRRALLLSDSAKLHEFLSTEIVPATPSLLLLGNIRCGDPMLWGNCSCTPKSLPHLCHQHNTTSTLCYTRRNKASKSSSNFNSPPDTHCKTQPEALRAQVSNYT